MRSIQLSLVHVGLHDFQIFPIGLWGREWIFPDRTAHAWSVEAGKMRKQGNICSVSVFFVRVGSQISPRRAKKDSNIPSPGRTRSVKCPIPGPAKTIKSPPHALPWNIVKLRYFDWPIPVFIRLVGAWQSKGVYFTVNYRIIANPSRKAHPSFSCPTLRENWMHGMRDIQLTGHWKGRVAKVCLRHFRSFHFLSAPAPHRNFILIVLSSVCCTVARVPRQHTRLLQVFVSKFLFYYPYFYTTIVLCQFMMVFKALKLFKDDTIKIKILLLQTLIFRRQIVFISF